MRGLAPQAVVPFFCNVLKLPAYPESIRDRRCIKPVTLVLGYIAKIRQYLKAAGVRYSLFHIGWQRPAAFEYHNVACYGKDDTYL